MADTATGRSPHTPTTSAPIDQPLDRVLRLSSHSPSELCELLDRVGVVGMNHWAAVEHDGPVRLALFDPTPERIDLAKRVVQREKPWRGRRDLWFTSEGLISGGGHVALAFPGIEVVFEPHIDDVVRHFAEPLRGMPEAGEEMPDIERVARSTIAVERVLANVLASLGVRPTTMAGQSIGEWAGMIASGMVPPTMVDGFLATLRAGRFTVPELAYVACGTNVEMVEGACIGLEGLEITHDNCPHQTIVCGLDVDAQRLIQRLRDQQVMSQVLPFRSGFHSARFAPYLSPFEDAFRRVPLQPSRVPLWSATTCDIYPDDSAAVRELGVAHLVERVRFRELVDRMYEAGTRVFVQVGAGSLTGFVEDTLAGRPFLAVSANSPKRSGMNQLLRLLSALWAEGASGLEFEQLQVPHQSARRSAPSPVAPSAPLARPPIVETGKPTLAGPESPRGAGHPTKNGHRAGAPVHEALEALLAEVTTTGQLVTAAAARAGRPTHATPPLAPQRLLRHLELSTATVPDLIDHCFFHMPPGWPNLADRFPVVPMTTQIQFMMDAAAELVPGLRPVAVERVQALRWIVAAPPTHVTIEAALEHPIDDNGQARVGVSLGEFSRCTVVLAERFASPPPAVAAPLVNSRPTPLDAEGIYEQRWLFHGPAFRGIVELGPIGDNGIDGTIEAGSAPGALFDNAGQLMGCWMMMSSDFDRFAMPVLIERIEFFGPMPVPGERRRVSVRPTHLDATTLRADLELHDGDRLWARIGGWEDRRFESDPAVWGVQTVPERSLLSEVHPAGWTYATEHWKTAASRDFMMRRYLNERERTEYADRSLHDQRQWLLGRIAAKDAVRRWLFDHRPGSCHPVEITVTNDERGAPIVTGPFDEDLRVSIAHTRWAAVALVAQGRDVGIDIERIEPRSEYFTDAAFSASERRHLLVDRPPTQHDETLTRGWAAKEAVGKSRRTGLAGRPKDLAIERVRDEQMCVSGRSVMTARRDEFVVAWTESETERSQIDD